MKNILLLSSLFFLLSCTGSSNQPDEKKGDEKHTNDSIQLSKEFVTVGDSMIIPSFVIELQLSKAAEEKLKADHESVIVDADISGIPRDTNIRSYRETGEFFLGNCRIELFNERIAKFNRVMISKKNYEQLADKNFEILVNVYSGRKSSQNNLLDCEILQGKFDTIKGQRFVLKGKLIGE